MKSFTYSIFAANMLLCLGNMALYTLTSNLGKIATHKPQSIKTQRGNCAKLTFRDNVQCMRLGDTFDVCFDLRCCYGEHAHLPEVFVAQPHDLIAVVEAS